MSATNQLRADHDQVRRLEKVVLKCADELYKGTKIPFSDLRKITIVISEFIDTIHHSREEDSYFPCVASYDTLKDQIRKFLIEHEFGRNIARQRLQTALNEEVENNYFNQKTGFLSLWPKLSILFVHGICRMLPKSAGQHAT